MEKIKIRYPVIVEGKYDKNTLMQLFDTTVIATGGFSIFSSKEKQAICRKIAKDGLIILTDSDGAGGVIRSFLKGILPKEKIFNLYIPKIEGKERRKTAPSKEGYLGVEGMDRNTLVKLFEPFALNDADDGENTYKCKEKITKTHFYLDKLSGADNSTARRDRLAAEFGLPCGMTANALLEALNIIAGLDEYKEAVGRIGD